MARKKPKHSTRKLNGHRAKRTPRRVKSLQKYLSAYGRGSDGNTARQQFARRVSTTLPYLIHIGYGFRLASAKLATDIEKHTHGLVTVEELRPDIDWSYLASHLARRAPQQAPR